MIAFTIGVTVFLAFLPVLLVAYIEHQARKNKKPD